MEVRNTVQEAVIKTVPKKKAKWLSEEAVQIAVKRGSKRHKAPELPAHPHGDLGGPGHSRAREKPTRSTGLRPGSLLGKRPGAAPSIYPPKPY